MAIKKIEVLDKPIKDKGTFICDIKTQIKNCRETLGYSAVLCTSESFFDKKNGMNSLKDVFKKHNIDIKGYMISITITGEGVFVVDGFGAGKKKINYEDIFVD